MVDFHEVRFPTTISKGSSGGPRRRTDVVTLRSGYEERNTVWADSRREYDAGLGVRDIDDMHDVLAFFEARSGRLYGFRWKDWADYKSCPPMQTVTGTDQVAPLLSGQTRVHVLEKVYTSGPTSWTRKITKPVSGSVVCAADGILLVEGHDFLVDTLTGLLYIGYSTTATITVGFEFDVPVRFSNDYIDIGVEQFNAGALPQIGLIEVKTGTGTAVSNELLDLALWNWLSASDIDASVNTNWNNIWGTE